MTGREQPWLCHCGYVSDAFSCFADENAVPKPGDLSMCLNCGERYLRVDDQWRVLTTAEYNALEPEAKRTLLEMEYARSLTITEDLAKGRGGRA